MSTEAETQRKVPDILACRPGEMEPLVQVWLDKNPGKTRTALLKHGLKLALKAYAGRRYAHLVDTRSA